MLILTFLCAVSILRDSVPWVCHILAYLLSRDTNLFIIWYYFGLSYQECVSSEQPWKIDMISPFEMNARLVTDQHARFGFLSSIFLAAMPTLLISASSGMERDE